MEESTDIDDVSLESVNLLNMLNESPEECVKMEEVKKETQSHSLCHKLFDFILNGWPEKSPVGLERFHSIRNSLDIENGCVFYGERVFVPPMLRQKFLKMIHREHTGIVKCKQLARHSIWWPNLDKDIEQMVNTCDACCVYARKGSRKWLESWPKTEYPFQRVHLDHFYFENKHYLIIFDVFSSWLHVDCNKSESSECVLLSLRKFIAIFGKPTVIVSDNGTSFLSRQFNIFVSQIK